MNLEKLVISSIHLCIKMDITYMFLVKAFRRFDEKGRLMSAIGSILDITERKKVENDLRKSKERNRQLKDLLPGGVVLGSLDGGINLAAGESL